VTKLDVLTGLDAIKVCTGYRGEDGAEFDHFPYHQSVLHHARGSYVELPGWSEPIGEAACEEELPANARRYLAFVEEFVGVPVALVGVGPGREQTLWTAAGRETTPGRAVLTG
jgi:adenylosuccinate synthase